MAVSIGDQDKAWLQRMAHEKGASVAELLREGIRGMRKGDQAVLDQALMATRGIWRDGDGLGYQRRLRREWK